jgi:four helix bundle protein
MFDFEKLEVYRRSKFFHIEVAKWLESEKEIPKYLRDQLHRASFSVALNIAEGTARFTKPDKRNFFVIARGSVFECYAIFDIYENLIKTNEETLVPLKSTCEELSKMLFAMIRNLQ